jgi:serine/threonine protein kinase
MFWDKATRGWIPKIADFGLALIYAKEFVEYTSKIITLYWRPPELLLYDVGIDPIGVVPGAKFYSSKVDVWSMGLILGYLFLGKDLITGIDEKDVLKNIIMALGPFDEDVAEQVIYKFPQMQTDISQSQLVRKLRPSSMFNSLPQEFTKFLLIALTVNPIKRPSARTLLANVIFQNQGLKCGVAPIEYFPIKLSYTEIYTKEIRTQAIEEVISAFEEISLPPLFLAIDMTDRIHAVRGLRTSKITATTSTTDAIQYQEIVVYTLFACYNMAAMLYRERGIDLSFLPHEMEFRILSLLKFRLFRPTIDMIFQEVDDQKLLECYKNNLVPDDVDKCI